MVEIPIGARTPRLPRLVRRVLLGAGIAVAAATGSVAFGLGSSAWAADSGDSASAGGLGSTLSSVTAPVIGVTDSILGSSPVTTVVEPVAVTTDSVLDSVPVVAPVVDAVLPAEPVQTIVSPVTETVDGVLDLAGGTVGTVVDVVDEVGGVVDETLPQVTDPVIDVIDPVAPAAPVVTGTVDVFVPGGAVAPTFAVLATTTGSGVVVDPVTASATAEEQVAPSRPLDGATVSDRGTPSGAPATGWPAQVGVTGSTTAGAGGSAPAGPAGDRPTTPRAPLLNSAVSAASCDDALPASATYDTDSSPD